jgi:hypothetical protein
MSSSNTSLEIGRAGRVAARALSRAALTLSAVAAMALLAMPSYGADDLSPPPLPAEAPSAPQPADAQSAPPPRVVEEKAPTAFGAPVPYWTHPLDDPLAPKPQRDVQIEQKHVGRRVSEVIVTPAGFTYHYSITHLDEQEPGTTPLQQHQELSVPRLFRFDF